MGEFTEALRTYGQLVLHERFWSWSLVGILYLVAGMIVRGWFINPVIAKAKELDSKYYHEIQRAYLKRSVPGWMLFFISFLIFVAVWNQEISLPLSRPQTGALGVALLSYFFSILFHVQAFAKAAVITMLLVQHETNLHDIKIKK